MPATAKQRTIIAVVTILLAAAAFLAWFFSRPQQDPFQPSGGEVFAKKIVLDVPLFLQNDERWAGDEIGTSGSRMGGEGCAVASVAMLLAYYGIDTNPKDLNEYLSRNNGYTREGWIYWNKATEPTEGKVAFTYAGPGSFEIIDANIKDGNPVIVKVLINKSIPHWVLVVGKEGGEYLINDPLASDKKVRKLSRYDSNIYAVRIYEVKAQ